MKKRNLIPTLEAVLLGGLAFFLDAVLLRDGTSGMVRTPAAFSLGVLTILGMLFFFLTSRNPGSGGLLPRRLGWGEDLPAAICLGMLALRNAGKLHGFLQYGFLLLAGLAAAAAGANAAVFAGKRQSRSLCKSLICLFFAGMVLFTIRFSVGDPQAHRYLPGLLADASLMAFSCCDAENTLYGNQQKGFAFWRMTGIYFSLMAAVSGGLPYLFGAFWLVIKAPHPVVRKEGE